MSKTCNVEVKQRKGEDENRLIKRFMKKVQKQGIVKEAIERSRYISPSEERNKKNRKAALVKRKQKEVEEKEKHSRGRQQ